jgi:hypothetical protein
MKLFMFKVSRLTSSPVIFCGNPFDSGSGFCVIRDHASSSDSPISGDILVAGLGSQFRGYPTLSPSVSIRVHPGVKILPYAPGLRPIVSCMRLNATKCE